MRNYTKERICLRIGSKVFRFFALFFWPLVSCLNSSYAYTTYSDATLWGGSSPTIVAWAVTDVTNYQYEHWASVRVSLTSPDGRSSTSSTVTDLNSVRTQISMSWSQNDLGNYRLRSWHDATCSEMGNFLDVLKTLSFKVGVAFVCYAYAGNQFGFQTYQRVASSCPRCTGPATIIVSGTPTNYKLAKRPYLRIRNKSLCVTLPWYTSPSVCNACWYAEIGP